VKVINYYMQCSQRLW